MNGPGPYPLDPQETTRETARDNAYYSELIRKEDLIRAHCHTKTNDNFKIRYEGLHHIDECVFEAVYRPLLPYRIREYARVLLGGQYTGEPRIYIADAPYVHMPVPQDNIAWEEEDGIAYNYTLWEDEGIHLRCLYDPWGDYWLAYYLGYGPKSNTLCIGRIVRIRKEGDRR